MWIHRETSINLMVIDTFRINVLFANRRYPQHRLDDVLEQTYCHYVDHTLIYTVDSWSDKWRQVDARPRHRIESVVLDGEIREQWRLNVRDFFAKHAWYSEMGIPWA